ncbi:MAG TPA: hypothetical protein VM260_27890 [Pirellula sp.]|nr:hypothetical protein [Pirellula sp.]
MTLLPEQLHLQKRLHLPLPVASSVKDRAAVLAKMQESQQRCRRTLDHAERSSIMNELVAFIDGIHASY